MLVKVSRNIKWRNRSSEKSNGFVERLVYPFRDYCFLFTPFILLHRWNWFLYLRDYLRCVFMNAQIARGIT